SLASTGTNNSSIHSGESDGSDVSLIIPVNPCYSPPPQGPNGSQPILTVSESQPVLLGSLTQDHLDHYCQQKLNARSAVAQRVGQTAYSWQCHQTLNDGTQMPSIVM